MNPLFQQMMPNPMYGPTGMPSINGMVANQLQYGAPAPMPQGAFPQMMPPTQSQASMLANPTQLPVNVAGAGGNPFASLMSNPAFGIGASLLAQKGGQSEKNMALINNAISQFNNLANYRAQMAQRGMR